MPNTVHIFIVTLVVDLSLAEETANDDLKSIKQLVDRLAEVKAIHPNTCTINTHIRN